MRKYSQLQTYIYRSIFQVLLCIVLPYLAVSQSYLLTGIDSLLAIELEISLGGSCQDDGKAFADKAVAALHDANYFEASLEQSSYQDSIYSYTIFQGAHYDTGSISLGNIPANVLEAMRIDPNLLTAKYHPKYSQKVVRDVLRFYAQNGYPMAKLSLDSVDIVEQSIAANWNLEPGKEILFDSVKIEGNTKVKPYFAKRLTGITSYEPFDIRTIEAIPLTLKKLKYLKLTGEPKLSLFDKWCTVTLPIEDVNNSKFDLLFGIIPSDNIDNRAVFLSADIYASLQNKLGFGEYFVINFEKLRPENQKLAVSLGILYPFDLPFGVDFGFDLFRRSTEFYDVSTKLGLRWPISRTTELGVYAQFNSNRLIEVDTSAILNSRQLPNLIDAKNRKLVVEYTFDNQDNPYNPQKGNFLRAELQGGQRTVIPNIQIQALKSDIIDFSDSYDTLALKSIVVQTSLEAKHFWRLGPNGALMTGLKGKFLYAGAPLRTNELLRLGGSQNLRGFDEEQYFSQWYSIVSTEYRLLIAENSYIALPFVDVSLFDSAQLTGVNMSISVGSGLSFETKAGILNLAVAVAKLNADPIDLARPKVHIGFNNVF